MIRLLNAYFARRILFLGISEACLVALAFVAATIARFGANDAALMLRYEQGEFKIFMVSTVFIGCMYYFDLYDNSIMSNRREVLARLVQVLGVVCILLALRLLRVSTFRTWPGNLRDRFSVRCGNPAALAEAVFGDQ